jgi:hypothetical protein
MKFGMLTIVGFFVISLMTPDDAEARRRWRGRWRNAGYSSYASQGCCGVPVSCCGVAAAPAACPTGACGVATSACPGGVCDVTGGAYSGGYSAGYGANIQGMNQPTLAPGATVAPGAQGTYRQNGVNQAPPPPAPNGSTLQQNQSLNGSAPSPSDRTDSQAPPPPTAGGESAGQETTERSAPPPPPDQNN